MNSSLNESVTLNRNSRLFTHNLECFTKRFPELAKLLEPELQRFQNETASSLTFFTARNGQISAKENGTALHSAYDPGKDAERSLQRIREKPAATALVFMSFGLGYAPVAAAAQFPSLPFILIEPDPERLFTAFAITDWTELFEHEQLMLCIGAPQYQLIPLLERFNLDDIFIFRTPAWELHAIQYFSEFAELLERNRQKKAINTKTLESFSHLWFRNMCTNLPYMADCTGITGFENCARDLPACVLAAGPSLDSILPNLAEIKERCLLICVDTALRACLAHGVQPDFVVLADPQYWNARHLDRLSAPETILITESAAYPSVFRFSCKETVLCSSLFPLGQYIEKKTGTNGKLGTGGSVASTAWDFARYCGSKTIFIAGLDLGYPGGRTHAAGSTFEEKAHNTSNRLQTAESTVAAALYGTHTEIRQDYTGQPIRSDRRMALYAWWFESRCAEFPEISTITLTPESTAIPGIKTGCIDMVRKLPERRKKVQDVLSAAIRYNHSTSTEKRRMRLSDAIRDLRHALTGLLSIAQEAQSVCQIQCRTTEDYMAVIRILQNFDREILKNEAAELTALLFPTKKQLEVLLSSETTVQNDNSPFQNFRKNIHTSEVIYRELEKSITAWLSRLVFFTSE